MPQTGGGSGFTFWDIGGCNCGCACWPFNLPAEDLVLAYTGLFDSSNQPRDGNAYLTYYPSCYYSSNCFEIGGGTGRINYGTFLIDCTNKRMTLTVYYGDNYRSCIPDEVPSATCLAYAPLPNGQDGGFKLDPSSTQDPPYVKLIRDGCGLIAVGGSLVIAPPAHMAPPAAPSFEQLEAARIKWEAGGRAGPSPCCP